MVDIYSNTALCVKDYSLSDLEGNRFEIKRGKFYTTTKNQVDGKVTVFTNYWVKVPVEYFSFPDDDERSR